MPEQPESLRLGDMDSVPTEQRPIITVAGPGGRRVDMRVLLQLDEPERRIRILADHEYMKIFLQYTPVVKGLSVIKEELYQFLRQARVFHGIDQVSISFLVELLNRGETPGLFEVARGTPPRRGDDGSLDLLVKPTSREPSYELDESGNVNYKRLNLFENVTKGQHIARMRSPTQGKSGRNVLGEDIPASDGRPLTVRLGVNTLADDRQMNFYADADGRVEFQKNCLSVQTTYEVSGDVDYSVGHIDFVGEVLIHGNVLDEFHVRGVQGVQIRGRAGNSRLESEKCVEVQGGMAGKNEGKIRAGNAVLAKYLNEVDVLCRGDVQVQNEMMGSTVRTTGRVLIPNGSILGGDITAFRGVVADVIGSDLGVPTRIGAGLDWTIEEKIHRIESVIAEFVERIEQIEHDVQPLLEERETMGKLSKEQKVLVKDLLEKFEVMREELQRAEEEEAGLRGRVQMGQVSQVNVDRILHPGVLFRFRSTQFSCKDAYRGPLTVVEDLENEMVRIVEQFPLIDDDAPERPSIGNMKDIGSRPSKR